MNTQNSSNIDAFHRELNSGELVESKWLDKNHIAYELVCYVNNIIALYMAGNYDYLPVLIDRAKGYLTRHDAAVLNQAYRKRVSAYLDLMESEFCRR